MTAKQLNEISGKISSKYRDRFMALANEMVDDIIKETTDHEECSIIGITSIDSIKCSLDCEMAMGLMFKLHDNKKNGGENG